MGAYEEEALRLKTITDDAEACALRICEAAGFSESELASIQSKDVVAQGLVTAMQNRINAVDDASVIGQLIDANNLNEQPIINIYVDTSVVNGEGSYLSPFNNVTDACLAVKSGFINKIFLRNGQVFELGSSTQTTQIIKDISHDTSILFVSGAGDGNRAHLKINFYNQNGRSYSSFRFNVSGVVISTNVRIHIGFLFVKVTTVAATNPISIVGGMIYGNYGNVASIYARLGESARDGDTLTIASNTILVSMYIVSARCYVSLNYLKLDGGGEIVSSAYGDSFIFSSKSLTRAAGSTATVFSHIRSDFSNVLTANKTLSFLAKTLD